MNFNKVDYELSAGTFAQLPACTMPEIVFSGRSNVGKSSLINKILNRKNLARVSSQPGKTITINFYKSDTARLVDLPGYGYAKHSFDERNRWGQMIEQYFQSDRDIRLVVQLIDMRHKPTEDDMQMLDFLSQVGMPYIVALTKSDKLNKTEYSECLKMHHEIIDEFNPIAIVPFSSVKGEGAEDVRNYIQKAEAGKLEAPVKAPLKVKIVVKK
ncbi:MAG: ribosome biogenesis GTP-binding protein YihA/YsxC [Clostridia bacterium]|nr:YihA family ribosome biogenesis GTP-binding protein [Candidatus Limimonas egerieequi]MCQ2489087.1 ribosome biogenesis GTP-binding protein YihA/YsxC [Clostridia bacterium]